ncbi:MAG: class I SAM-dependent methyltransferase [Kiritimatiellae bacterium]|nr:class I SAM-dependent methyltransferase [Kiritimatiellia bacterium]
MRGEETRAAEYWDMEARRYEQLASAENARRIYPMHEFRNKYVLELLGDKPCRHLEIGCGPGRAILGLMQQGWREVSGVDISPGMIELAKRTIAGAGYDPAQADLKTAGIEALPFKDGTFDSVACVGVIEYIRDEDSALREIARVMKPGGNLVITVRNRMCLYRPSDLVAPLLHRVQGGEHGAWFRTHIPWKFSGKLAQHGLVKKAHAYYHFYVVPAPFDRYLHGRWLAPAIAMERLSACGISALLASGLIVKAQKNRNPEKGD